MDRINMKRVCLAGLAAGLVFFLTDAVADELVVGNEIRTALRALGKPEPQESAAMLAYLVVFSAVFGSALVWLYAAIRPRFGCGLALRSERGSSRGFSSG